MNSSIAQARIDPADSLSLYGELIPSRLIIGSALYPSPKVMQECIQASSADVVTVSLRRQSPGERGGDQFWDMVRSMGLKLLPNTAGCHSVKEAVALAQMSRELFETDWIKLEVIGDDYNLQPDPVNLLRAAEQLIDSGFKVFPYCTDDLVVCRNLVELGCQVVMPWGSPIGTGQGLINPYALQSIRDRLPDTTLIIDAGIGKPSDACQAMELGYDGIMLNTAVARAINPPAMARAFAEATRAGRRGYSAGAMPKRQTASPSTPTAGTPFWHHERDDGE